MTKHARPSRIARLGRYATKRLAGPLSGLPGHQALREAARGMGAAMRPKRLDRGDLAQGYRGRHADGGRARFRAIAEGSIHDDDALARLAARQRRHARAVCAATAAALIGGAALPFLAQDRTTALAGLALGPIILAMLATALRSDFAAWQIEQRRFGGFAEYVTMRWTGGRVAQSPDPARESDDGGLRELGALVETAAAPFDTAESAIAKGVAPSHQRHRRGSRQRRRHHRRRRRHQQRHQRRRESER